MYCYNNPKTNSLSGVNPRETSWRTYSKSLIVELKEKLADRRARTLALLSENGDLAAFNEIDTESDGLDDTSTNMTNVQDQSHQQGTEAQGHLGEQNSLSETSSLTESDYNEADIREEESKPSPEIPIIENSRCCSGSCSTINSISGGSYTSEDVSSRSLDDFVADINLVVDMKEEHYRCSPSQDITCSMHIANTKVQEKYKTNESLQNNSYQTYPCHFDERNLAATLSKSSLHFHHSIAAHMSPLSINFDNESRLLLKAKSDTSLFVAMQSETAHADSYSTVAGLLIVGTVIQTSFDNLLSTGSSSSIYQLSSQDAQDIDSTPVERKEVDEKTSMQTSQESIISMPRELTNKETIEEVNKYFELDEYYLSKELEDYVKEDKEEKDEENDDKTVDNSEEGEEAKTQQEVGDNKVSAEEIREKTETKIEEQVQQDDTLSSIQHDIQPEDDTDRACCDNTIIKAPDEEILSGEAMFRDIDSQDSEINSRDDKLQDQTIVMDDHKPLWDLKVMLDEMVQIFESNTEFYHSVDKSLVTMFENHSTDFSMVMSAYKNKSGNSGYIEPGKQTPEPRAVQSSCDGSSRTDTAPKLDDQNQSLQECLEKARVASTMQDTVSNTTDKTDNVTSIKTYQQTVAELEKSMLDYLQVYAKEAIAEGLDSKLPQSSDVLDDQQKIKQNRQTILRRSDTFVVKEQCTGKPPNISKRRHSNGSLKKGTKVNTKQINKVVCEEAGDCKSEESLNAPHSSPTFLITDDFWNNFPDLFDMPKSDQDVQDTSSKIVINSVVGSEITKQHKSTAGPSCNKDDRDFDSDTTESLSDTKVTENLTYTSSLLAQLLDYNSADECRPLKDSAKSDIEHENNNTRFNNKSNEDPDLLEVNGTNDKKKRICYEDGSENVEDDPFCRSALLSSSSVKLLSFEKIEESINLENYDSEEDLNVDNDDTDHEDRTFDVKTKSASSPSHDYNRRIVKESSSVDKNILTLDVRNYKEKTNFSQEKDEMHSSPSALPRETIEKQRLEELCCLSEVSHAVVYTKTNTRDTSPLEKARPDDVIIQNMSSKYSETDATSRDCFGNVKNFILEQDDQHSHKKWQLSRKVREKSLQNLSEETLTLTAEWSSSDEDAVDDLQRDVSPSDLLRQKQKRDVDEKLQQLEQYSRRKKKSRSPLRHKTSTEAPSWIQNAGSHHQANVCTAAINIATDTHDRKCAGLDKLHENKLHHLNKYTSLRKDFDISGLCSTEQEEENTEVLMSASQLMQARYQENDMHNTDSSEFEVKLKTKIEERNRNQPKIATTYERSKEDEIKREPHSEYSSNEFEEDNWEWYSKRSASINSRKYAHTFTETRNITANKNEDELIDMRSKSNDNTVTVSGKILGFTKDNISEDRQGEFLRESSVNTCTTMRDATEVSRNHVQQSVAQKVTCIYSDTPVNNYVDKSSRNAGEEEQELHEVTLNLNVDNHRSYQKNKPAENINTDPSLLQLNSCEIKPATCLETSVNNHLQDVYTCGHEVRSKEIIQPIETLEERSQIQSITNADCTWDAFIKSNAEFLYDNQKKTHPGAHLEQTFSTSEFQETVESGKLMCENTVGDSLDKNIQEDEQGSIKERSRSVFQVTLQENTLNKLDLIKTYLPSQGEQSKSLDEGIQSEYYAIDALRYKVNCLEQMLRNSDIINDSYHRRSARFVNKDTPTSSEKQISCPCCQQSFASQSHSQTQFQPITKHERYLHSPYQEHLCEQKCIEKSHDWNVSSICSCGHRSYLNLQNDENLQTRKGVNRQSTLSSKECQTSGGWTLDNQNSKTGPYVDSWTQYDSTLDSKINESLEDRLSLMYNDIQGIKHHEECASTMMTELNDRINRFTENTATILDGHSKQLENSQVCVSEGFKQIQESIERQNDTSKSMREYLTVTEQNWDTILQTLKSQHMDALARSVKTVEETVCPLQEYFLDQKKEIEEIRTSLQSVVSSLENSRSDVTKRGMNYDTMKERIVDVTSQRDAEKVFHRITRQSLRALERDHDRLRQEYIRATCRRHNYVSNTTDSDVRNRMWYNLNNQDLCHPCNNNRWRDTHPRSGTWTPQSASGGEEDSLNNSGQTTCGRLHSHRHLRKYVPDCQRLQQCACTSADDMKDNELSSHRKSGKTTDRNNVKSKNSKRTLSTNSERNQENENRSLNSNNSQNYASSKATKSCLPSQDQNNASFCESDLSHECKQKELVVCHIPDSSDGIFINDNVQSATRNTDISSTKDEDILISKPCDCCQFTSTSTRDFKQLH